MKKTIKISTKENTDIINITDKVENFLKESKIRSGIINVFAKHTTAGLAIIENETGVIQDFKEFFEKIAPINKPYNHNKIRNDDNGHAHICTPLLGQSLTIPFEDNKLSLGIWQQIFLVDFDTQARTREVVMTIVEDR